MGAIVVVGAPGIGAVVVVASWAGLPSEVAMAAFCATQEEYAAAQRLPPPLPARLPLRH